MSEPNIPYALDENGNQVLPQDAITEVVYHCPYCGVKVHRGTSIYGIAYFAVMPGCSHTAPECEMVSLQTASAKRRYAMEKTNPIPFMKALLREPVQSTGQASAAGNNPESSPKGIVPKALKTFRSLSELYESGACFLWPGTPMGNGHLSDCCCCVEPLIANIVDDPLFRGEKIIYAGVDDISGADFVRLSELIAIDRPRIAFPVFTKYKSTTYRRKYLVLECKSDDILDTIIEALYDRTLNADGRTMYKARCRNVLVAGNWRRGRCSDCPHSCSQARSDCKGVLLAPYVSPKQLYGIIQDQEPLDESPQAEKQDNRTNCAATTHDEL